MTATDATAPVVDLSHEASTGLFEVALIAVVVALAAAYLWRTYFRRRGKGKGGGCASCGSAAQCPMQPGQEAKQGAGHDPDAEAGCDAARMTLAQAAGAGAPHDRLRGRRCGGTLFSEPGFSEPGSSKSGFSKSCAFTPGRMRQAAARHANRRRGGRQV